MAKLSYLASVSKTREVLEQFGLMTKKALGQHFLINDGIVSRICDFAQLSQDDVVVEVGPGIGTLSVALLQKAQSVIAIERDSDLPPVLAQTCAPYSDRFTLIEQDALNITEDSFSTLPNKLVSNLPYAVAATIVLDYFERFSFIESMTVMVQAEVAERMCAKQGTKNYGAYTVKLGLFCDYVAKFSVSEGNFFPPPRVKSSVIRLDRKQEAIPDDLRKATMIMADAAFANRRKTIANSMKMYFSNPQTENKEIGDLIPELLQRANIDGSLRGESLSQEEFLSLGEAYMALV